MNAERLHAIVIVLSQEMNKGNTPSKMEELINALQNVINQSSHPPHQQTLAQNLKAMYASVTDTHAVRSHILLLPGIPRDFSDTGPITGITIEEAKAVNEGTVTHYVWGIIRYHTATGKKCTTKFCFRYVPRDKSFAFCEEHNDAD